MLALAVFTNDINLNKIPSGSGIDFLVWPLMVIGFGVLIYFVVQNAPKEKNKDRDKE
jgi:selenophosphate synthetase-related protein